MAGRSRSKNGVLENAYVPAIHVLALSLKEDVAVGINPGMTNERLETR